MATQQTTTPFQRKLKQAVTDGQLGSSLGIYEPASMARGTFILGIIILLLGSIFVAGWFSLIFTPDAGAPLEGILAIGIIVAWPIFILGLYVTYTGLKGIRQTIYLYQRGLIVGRWNRLAVYPWTQVKGIRQRITSVYRAKPGEFKLRPEDNEYAGTKYVYFVECADGKTLKLDAMVQNIRLLGEMITSRFNTFFLPLALASLTAGETVSFGPWSLDLQGIHGEQGILPWSAVSRNRIHIQRGDIAIFTGKGRHWATYPIHRILNIFVFLDLVDSMSKTQNKT